VLRVLRLLLLLRWVPEFRLPLLLQLLLLLRWLQMFLRLRWLRLVLQLRWLPEFLAFLAFPPLLVLRSHLSLLAFLRHLLLLASLGFRPIQTLPSPPSLLPVLPPRPILLHLWLPALQQVPVGHLRPTLRRTFQRS
jgi:hypothetical protein